MAIAINRKKLYDNTLKDDTDITVVVQFSTEFNKDLFN